MLKYQINYIGSQSIEIEIIVSREIQFIEVYYKFNLLKHIKTDTKFSFKNLTHIRNKTKININTCFIPDNSKIELIGFSKKKLLHKLFEFTIRNETFKLPKFKSSLLNPIIFTSLGRSGTTFFMNLLANVDEIVSDKTYPLENKYASKMFEKISNHTAVDSNYNNISSRVNQIKQKVDEYYLTLSKEYYKKNPKYFIEKSMRPYYILDPAYENSKNIFLVRNFEDIIISSLNFNRKRGNLRFGREHVNDDLEFIEFKAEQARKWIFDPYMQIGSNSLLVKYENLIENTQNELKKILDFLDIDFENDKIERILRQTKKDSEKYSFHKTTIRENICKDINSKYSVNQIRKKIKSEFYYLEKEFGYLK